ncbi:hypothetical protein JTB14_027335 [Gonioctena quinquepunctata]|nr:hypothetical protein JTB14_027335 [Gonioctena quinquepunctata]
MKFAALFVYYFVSSLVTVSVLCQDKIRINFEIDNEIDEDSKKETTTTKTKKTTSKNVKITKSIPEKLDFICPEKHVARPFFALPCTTTKDCGILGKDTVCCERRCIEGVERQKPDPKHSPTLFGLVEQICPSEPVPEIWEIKECSTDDDCAPRICCPESLKNGQNMSYCRTAQPLWEKLPAAKQFVDPIRTLVGYMQCTPPPPPLLDLFPLPCNTPLDCFPNLCCQEGGKRYCRPPKRSLLALIAGIGQRIIPSEAAKEFIKRIS